MSDRLFCWDRRALVKARRLSGLPRAMASRRSPPAICLRENVQRATELGVQARDVMARGELVSDDLVCDMVKDRLREQDCKRGFILDGFPRTPAQAGWLDAFLEHEFFDNSNKDDYRGQVSADCDPD